MTVWNSALLLIVGCPQLFYFIIPKTLCMKRCFAYPSAGSHYVIRPLIATFTFFLITASCLAILRICSIVSDFRRPVCSNSFSVQVSSGVALIMALHILKCIFQAFNCCQIFNRNCGLNYAYNHLFID